MEYLLYILIFVGIYEIDHLDGVLFIEKVMNHLGASNGTY